ncbi:MAG TPA: M23 family metallopeptidase [Thermoanaerobaculia bacterium]|nr:M23 family metallopeptidase [Thermoanaerobaculia bacterium]
MRLQTKKKKLPWGLLAILAVIATASVYPAGVGQAASAPEVYGMLFPVLGEHTLTDSFGDPRDGGARSHAGIDILADRMIPVVAVADGKVRWLHDGTRGNRCCDVAIRHDDGWTSRYFHLNNDTPGTDDGRAVGIAPGIRRGARVVAGQLVGWVGDSGNAEATVPHLHFELRRPDGRPIDPLASLRAALVTGRPLAPPSQLAEGDDGADGDAGDDEQDRGGLLGWLLRDRNEAAGEGAPEADERLAEREAPAFVPPKMVPPPPPSDAVEVVPEAQVAVDAPPGLSRERRVERLPSPPRRAQPEPRRDALSCFGFASRRGDAER